MLITIFLLLPKNIILILILSKDLGVAMDLLPQLLTSSEPVATPQSSEHLVFVDSLFRLKAELTSSVLCPLDHHTMILLEFRYLGVVRSFPQDYLQSLSCLYLVLGPPDFSYRMGLIIKYAADII